MNSLRNRAFHDWKVRQLAARAWERRELATYSGLRHRQRGFIINPFSFGVSGGDPYFSDVRMLLHMNGANSGTTFTDSSSFAHTITRGGGPITSTAQVKYGSASLYISMANSNANYLDAGDSSNLEFGASDFCVEGWLYLGIAVTSGQGGPVFSSKYAASNFEHICYSIGGASSTLTLYFGWTTDGSTQNYVNSGSFTPALTTWMHIAYVRSGSNFYFWRNGTQQGSTGSVTGTIHSGTGVWRCLGWAGGSNTLTGNMDDIRVTVGQPRYTSSFTPPATQFPDF